MDIDVVRRKLYRCMYGTTSSSYRNSVGTFDLNTLSDASPTTDGTAPRVQSALGPGNQVTWVGGSYWGVSGAAYWPSKDEILAFRSSFTINRYSAVDMSFLGNITNESAFTINHICIHHGGYIYFSGYGGTKLYRVTPSYTWEYLCDNPVAMGCTDGMDGIAGLETNDYALWGVLGTYLYAFHKNGHIYRVDLSGTSFAWVDVGVIPETIAGTSVSTGKNGRYIHECGIAAAVTHPQSGEGVFLVVASQDQSPPRRTYLWKPPL
jgi:hypothetical protein